MGQGIAACIEASPTASMVVGIVITTTLMLQVIDGWFNRFREEKGHE